MTTTLSTMAKFSNGKKKNDSIGDIPVYGGNGIFGYTDSANSENCVIIGRVGAYCGSVHFEPSTCWISDNAIRCEAKRGNDIRFLYYLLRGLKLDHRQIGTSQPLLTQGILNAIEVEDAPSLEKQESIARFLRLFDEKIALNRKSNDYLLELCAARYGDARKEIAGASGTDQGVLTDLIEVCYGKDHKKLADGTYPVYGSGGLMRHVEKYLYEGESVLIPRKGTLNNVMLVNGRFWTVDTMFYTKELMEGTARYAYFILSKMDLASMNAGSAVPSMTTRILSAIPVALPSEALLAELKSWSDPLFEQIRLNEQENARLSTLRDALLPKLMSGEIDVSDVELPTQPNNHLHTD